MKHVQFVRGPYVVRITVPPELREIVGKRELVGILPGDKRAATPCLQRSAGYYLPGGAAPLFCRKKRPDHCPFRV